MEYTYGEMKSWEDDVEHSNTGNVGENGNQNDAQFNSKSNHTFNVEASDSDENVEEDSIGNVDKSGVSYGPDGIRWRNAMESLGLDKEPHELTTEDLVGKEFIMLEEAELFFNTYARLIGFCARKGHMRKNRDGRILFREWLCSKEGQRDMKFINRVDRVRQSRAITRTGCMVMLRVANCRKTNTWIVKQFKTKHSHPVAGIGHCQFLRSNRVVSGASLEVAKSMRAAGIRTCHAMTYMAEQRGAYHEMEFLIKDLYNKIGSSKRVELADSDAAKAIGYLEHKCEHDVGFYGIYSYDEHLRVKNIVWADSKCQSDYHAFGRTLAFDTTYETNAYGKPLLVWIGVNPHFRTTIFGFALLADETTETYKWVTKAFLECMKGLMPETVLTDGDNSMRAAINDLMPNTVHRLCAWHIDKNAIKNTHEPQFAKELRSLMFKYYTPDNFEKEWAQLLERFGLENNAWCKSLYNKKTTWAETFLRDHYFGGMMTTSRCESMNSLLKGKVEKDMSLFRIVKVLDRTLSWLRHREAKEDFDSLYTSPVLGESNMLILEKQAASIYTRRMFNRVRHQIKREGKYRVTPDSRCDDLLIFKLTKYGEYSSKRSVSYNTVTGEFKCQCNYFPNKGIPCRHMFAIMKEMNVIEIPDCLIQWQWTMHAREKLSKVADIAPRCNKSCSEESARFGYMNNLGAQMAYYSAKSETLFKMGEEMMLKSIASLKSSWEGVGDKAEDSAKQTPISKQIQNPLYTKTKGTAPKPGRNAPRTRRCSNCNNYGHNKMTCKWKKSNNLDSPRSLTSIAEKEGTEVDLADENDNWVSAGDNQSHEEAEQHGGPRKGKITRQMAKDGLQFELNISGLGSTMETNEIHGIMMPSDMNEIIEDSWLRLSTRNENNFTWGVSSYETNN